MLFIALGLIILLTSFLAALVMLIRELGQRSNIEDSINDFSLELADELIPAESGIFDSVIKSPDQPENILPPEVKVSNPPSINEVVPFPWETEAGGSQINDKAEPEYFEVIEKVSTEPPPSLSRDKLYDDFSVREIKEEIK